MKNTSFFTLMAFFLCFFLINNKLSGQQHYKISSAETEKIVDDIFTPLKPGKVKLKGKVGSEIDRVTHARILSNKAENEILPEALDAFHKRVDDRLRSNRGYWQGEFWGKWMLSAIEAHRYTGNQQLKQLIEESINNLLATQDPNGYIGTYYNSGFVKGNSWNVWCRKYTLWGLMEAYELLQKPGILKAASRFMDHLMTEVGPGHTDIVETGNFAGLPSSSILTPVMKLYRHTGNEQYLEYGRYITDQWSKDPGSPPNLIKMGLTGQSPHLWFPESGYWTKAYEFISCLEGLLDLYRVDGNEKYLHAVKNIYESIRQNDRVITGGIGYNDKLTGAAYRTEGLNEPCDVVYWQRLSLQLLRITGNPKYADEIERLTYNVLLAAMNRTGSWGVRRLGLSEPHLISPLHCYMDNHQCCVTNVPRGLLQLSEAAVMKGEKEGSIAVNLYIPGNASVMLPNGEKVTLKTQTDYPETGKIDITIQSDNPVSFPLKLRIPPWSEKTEVEVNGQPIEFIDEGSYLTIKRQWESGDQINIDLDIRPRIIPFKGSGNAIAYKRGPVVLARSTMIGRRIDFPVMPKVSENGVAELKRINAPGNIWMMFEAPTVDGDVIRLCDYASTGKDYQKPQNPYAHSKMANNRTEHDIRVWLPVPHGYLGDIK